jgi:hypothetical protein
MRRPTISSAKQRLRRARPETIAGTWPARRLGCRWPGTTKRSRHGSQRKPVRKPRRGDRRPARQAVAKRGVILATARNDGGAAGVAGLTSG